jgi:hypothetical protein
MQKKNEKKCKKMQKNAKLQKHTIEKNAVLVQHLSLSNALAAVFSSPAKTSAAAVSSHSTYGALMDLRATSANNSNISCACASLNLLPSLYMSLAKM